MKFPLFPSVKLVFLNFHLKLFIPFFSFFNNFFLHTVLHVFCEKNFSLKVKFLSVLRLQKSTFDAFHLLSFSCMMSKNMILFRCTNQISVEFRVFLIFLFCSSVYRKFVNNYGYTDKDWLSRDYPGSKWESLKRW